MTSLYLLAAAALLLVLATGMYRALRGPTPGDRILFIQLFGTTAVAMLLLIGKATNSPALVDVALLLALLAAITIVAFVRRFWMGEDNDESCN